MSEECALYVEEGHEAGSRLAFDSYGEWAVGSGQTDHLPLPQSGLDPGYLKFYRNELGLVFQGRSRVNLCGRPLRHGVPLVHGDVIELDGYRFRLAAPVGGEFPLLRMDDTLWTMRNMPVGWKVHPEAAALRGHEVDGQSAVFSQDVIGDHPLLTSYVSYQHRVIALSVDDYHSRMFEWPDPPGMEQSCVTIASGTFDGNAMQQIQYCGLYSGLVGVATVTFVGRSETKDAMRSVLTDLLANIHFG